MKLFVFLIALLYVQHTYSQDDGKKWLSDARKGSVIAMYQTAIRYLAGRDGLPLDKSKGVYWLKKGVEKRDLKSQYRLGMCYLDGEGVNKDELRGYELLKMSAEQGQVQAQYQLGAFLIRKYQKTGDNKDMNHAKLWIEKAAINGHPHAQYYLGVCYGTGEGYDVDNAKSAEWLEKAALQGHSSAQYAIGKCYEDGRGVKQSKSQAIFWYEKAAENGDSYSAEALKRLKH